MTRHDVGRGAAIGVLVNSAAAKAKQQQAAREQQKANYGRAFGVCMEARGYVIR